MQSEKTAFEEQTESFLIEHYGVEIINEIIRGNHQLVKDKISSIGAKFEKKIRLNERDAKKRTCLFYALY